MIGIDKKGWKKVKFGDVCRNLNVTIKSPMHDALNRVIGLEHIIPGNLHIESWNDISEGTTFTKTFKAGHVLFGKRRAYQKKAALADFDGICSGDILVFEAIEEKLIPRLLPFLVSSDRFFEYAVKTSAGSLSPRTKFQDLAMFEFLLPPIDQQDKLAELLWAGQLSEQTLTAVLAKSKLLYSAALNKYFGRRPEDKKSSRLVSLDDVCDISGGSTPSRNNKSFWDGNIPWLTPTDVTNQNEIEIDRTSEFISDAGLKAISNKLYPPGSILFCSRATIGAAVINKVPMATNQGFTNFICKEGVEPYYLYFYLQYLKDELLKLAGGSTFPEISKSAFRRFKIQLHCHTDQLEISRTIQEILKVVKGIEQSLTMFKKSQNGLTSKIFKSDEIY